MTAIGSVIALTSGRALCARCEACHAVTGGVWHAVEPALPHLPICDACAECDDPREFASMDWLRTEEP